MKYIMIIALIVTAQFAFAQTTVTSSQRNTQKLQQVGNNTDAAALKAHSDKVIKKPAHVAPAQNTQSQPTFKRPAVGLQNNTKPATATPSAITK